MRPKTRILVVDDNRSLVRVLAGVLRNAGYRVSTAFDGVEALEQVRERKPDLILLDIVMPRIDGYAVCRHLQGDPETAGIPVLILTRKGHVDETSSVFWRGQLLHAGLRDRIEAYEAGAVRFLTKPVTAETLLIGVEGALSLGLAERAFAQDREPQIEYPPAPWQTEQVPQLDQGDVVLELDWPVFDEAPLH